MKKIRNWWGSQWNANHLFMQLFEFSRQCSVTYMAYFITTHKTVQLIPQQLFQFLVDHLTQFYLPPALGKWNTSWHGNSVILWNYYKNIVLYEDPGASIICLCNCPSNKKHFLENVQWHIWHSLNPHTKSYNQHLNKMFQLLCACVGFVIYCCS